jgi:hypothetical protein
MKIFADIQAAEDRLDAEIRRAFLDYDDHMSSRYCSDASALDIFTAGYLAALNKNLHD